MEKITLKEFIENLNKKEELSESKILRFFLSKRLKRLIKRMEKSASKKQENFKFGKEIKTAKELQKDFEILEAKIKRNKLNKEEITNWLGKESSISATPHAQKSRACISIEVNREKQPLLDLISEVEQTLGTPVQVAVKRVDEQEFAKLNSENLMFSEDATRRIAHLLSQKPWVTHYQIAVKHFESLHPFEVACYINK